MEGTIRLLHLIFSSLSIKDLIFFKNDCQQINWLLQDSQIALEGQFLSIYTSVFERFIYFSSSTYLEPQ